MHEAPYSAHTQMRFWTKVKPGLVDECWEWQASKTGAGYGQFGVTGQVVNAMAHRVAYELLVGPIPDGLHIDHLCGNRACVNPAHLEPVLPEVNILRGQSPAAKNVLKTHCPKGHLLSGENLYVDPRPGKRGCKQCRFEQNQRAKAYQREWKARKRADEAQTGRIGSGEAT